MRITDQDREDAAIICAILASTPAVDGDAEEAGDAIDASPDARMLAQDAYSYATCRDLPYDDALAEAMIRDGWEPGDGECYLEGES